MTGQEGSLGARRIDCLADVGPSEVSGHVAELVLVGDVDPHDGGAAEAHVCLDGSVPVQEAVRAFAGWFVAALAVGTVGLVRAFALILLGALFAAHLEPGVVVVA